MTESVPTADDGEGGTPSAYPLALPARPDVGRAEIARADAPGNAATGPWAVRLPADKAASAAGLRLWPGVLTADTADGLWLRGEHLSDALDLELRKLPGAERFAVFDGGAVVPLGKRVPTEALPPGPWVPVAERFRLSIGPPALPGRIDRWLPLRLVRSGVESPADVLVVPLAAWVAWAVDAAQVRLRPLAFAASADGRAIVRGRPLPPLAGTRYVERDGVAVPAGWSLEPAVDPATVRALLGTASDDLALLGEGGGWERVAAGDFVAATRSAARATSGPLSPEYRGEG